MLPALAALCLCALLIASAAALHSLRSPLAPARSDLSLPKGFTLKQTARLLEKEGIIRSAPAFRLLGRWRGDAGRIQAGEYLFERPASSLEVMDRLVVGDVRRHPLTLPEGLRLTQIAAAFEALELAETRELLALAEEPAFLERLGIEAKSLEGYLFPDTYHFVRGTRPETLLETLAREMERRLSPQLLEEARKHGLNRHRLLTLASIIQKEAGNEEEMPLISAVFHNRLRKGMRLQTDPTVIYGIEDFDGNLTRKHLATPGPYNSYRNPGLPPGPIASPGLAAIRAAARPAEVDYLYFVSRGDGTHAFSRTLEEHNAKVRQFQLRR